MTAVTIRWGTELRAEWLQQGPPQGHEVCPLVLYKKGSLTPLLDDRLLQSEKWSYFVKMADYLGEYARRFEGRMTRSVPKTCHFLVSDWENYPFWALCSPR